MPLDITRTRQYLKAFDFKSLFIEELGWDHHTQTLPVSFDEQAFTLSAIAQKRGMVAFACASMSDGHVPLYATRRKIEHQLGRSVHEHLIIYTDANKTTQIWQWVKREPGRPTACREHTYHRDQPGDSLLQKLEAMLFTLEEEESLTIVDVAGRTRRAFDVERVTKRFYDRFTKEHDSFLKFLKGIPGEEMQRWYASVMINRLMFIYFIQKKGFLNDDTHYLRNKLKETSASARDRYYADFLCPLFFEGFAKREDERTSDFNRLLGKVPYLNGGIFQRHQIEELHGTAIQIADAAFAKIFDFFDQYQWHLDERPLRRDDEINPDVLGYIFEKYINQKQMGAYYTKEDITGYISQNTIIPRLFDMARQKCKIAFEGESSVWQHLLENPDRYIYAAVKRGVELPLPSEIAAGLNDVAKRTGWNRPAPEEYALPTEIWREVAARRKRCEEVRAKLLDGEVREINDLITYNLDIRQFAQDVIENSEGPDLLRSFWHALRRITILDPTCGSGAFLFAALNILEPLYEACLNRMNGFLEDMERSGEKHRPEKFSDFRKALAEAEKHPNLRYFILKSIILNNLYGVDIMEEAVEICKLRLFLKLVAQVEKVGEIEPLPDIDFNICAGNTLVGYTTREEIQRAMTMTHKDQHKMLLFAEEQETVRRIEEKAGDVDRLFSLFREQQTQLGGDVTAADKQQLRDRLKSLDDELNIYLAAEYGVVAWGGGKRDISLEYQRWLASHKPFHWFVDFHAIMFKEDKGIMKSRGFDVIVGNPPYVEYVRVRNDYQIMGFETFSSSNLYAFFTERSFQLLHDEGYLSLIVPLSLFCTPNMIPTQQLIKKEASTCWVSYYSNRPDQLFEGSQNFLSIMIASKAESVKPCSLLTTKLLRWPSEVRDQLFPLIHYARIEKNLNLPNYAYPKFSSNIENMLAKKIFAYSTRLSDLAISGSSSNNEPQFVYCYGGVYWTKARTFDSPVIREGKIAVSTADRPVYITDDRLKPVVGAAILNSSLHYWFWSNFSDCRNKTYQVMLNLPIPIDTVKTDSELVQLGSILMKDYRTNAERHVRHHRGGTTEFDEFYPRKSKPIIDEIDRVLAQHYGFTDEELDFIINYDIKYRMGRG